MSSKICLVLGLLLGSGVTLVVVRATQGPSRAAAAGISSDGPSRERAAPAPPRLALLPDARSCIDVETLRREVAAVVDERISRVGSSVPPAAGDDDSSKVSPAAQTAVSPENFAEAKSVVSRAVAAGRWTEADREALRKHVPQLDQKSDEELRRTLAVAINSGRLALDVDGTLF